MHSWKDSSGIPPQFHHHCHLHVFHIFKTGPLDDPLSLVKWKKVTRSQAGWVARLLQHDNVPLSGYGTLGLEQLRWDFNCYTAPIVQHYPIAIFSAHWPNFGCGQSDACMGGFGGDHAASCLVATMTAIMAHISRCRSEKIGSNQGPIVKLKGLLRNAGDPGRSETEVTSYFCGV